MVTWRAAPTQKMHYPHESGHVRSRDKLNRLPFHFQKTRRHPIMQGAALSFCIHKNMYRALVALVLLCQPSS